MLFTEQDKQAVLAAIESKPNGTTIFYLMSKCKQVVNLMSTVHQLADDGKIIAKTVGEWPDRTTYFFPVTR